MDAYLDIPHETIQAALNDEMSFTTDDLAQRLNTIRLALNDIVKMRVTPDSAEMVAAEEGELWALRNTLGFLLDDIRPDSIRHLRVVR